MAIPFTLKAKYSMKTDSIISIFTLIVILMSVVGFFAFAFHVYTYTSMNPRHDYSDYFYVETFFYFVFYAGDILASGNAIISAFLFLMAVFRLPFYSLQVVRCFCACFRWYEQNKRFLCQIYYYYVCVKKH